MLDAVVHRKQMKSYIARALEFMAPVVRKQPSPSRLGDTFGPSPVHFGGLLTPSSVRASKLASQADTLNRLANDQRPPANNRNMSYETAISRMFALGHELANTPSHKFDLAHMRVLLAALDHPERRFPAVLIAGTNGKGSTAATLASILQASGLRTGLYTSPHLVRINERIRINGQEIGDDDFALLHDVVDRTAERLVARGELPWHPSFFEMLTAMAFEYFSRRKIDIAVLEVGMGGRLDATNVVEPRLSVITDISLDHQKFLGNTVAEIAREKAGIIRPGGIVVTLPQQPQANDVIGNTILELGARAVSAVPYVPPVSPKHGVSGCAQPIGTPRFPLSPTGDGKGNSGGDAAGRPPSTAQRRAGDRGR